MSEVNKGTSEQLEQIFLRLNQDLDKLTLPARVLNTPYVFDYLARFKNLRGLMLIGNEVLTKEHMDQILTKTSITNVLSSNIIEINIEDMPSAIKYIGNTEAIYYDDLLISNDKDINTNAHFFYSEDIFYNLDTILSMITHFNVDIKNNHLNIIGLSEQKESICYNYRTQQLEFEGDPSKLQDVIDKFKEHHYGVAITTINLKDYSQETADFEYISDIVNISVGTNDMSLEEYNDIRDQIVSITNGIKENNLTPFEQMAYIYQSTKSSFIAKQVFDLIGIRSEEIGYLQTNMIRLNDEKYNVHGVFSFNPSVQRNDASQTSIEPLRKAEQAIEYSKMLTTKKDYKEHYPDADIPVLFEDETQGSYNKWSELPKIKIIKQPKDKYLKLLQTLFDNEEEVEEYLNVDKPPIEDYFKALETINNRQIGQEEPTYEVVEVQDEMKKLL